MVRSEASIVPQKQYVRRLIPPKPPQFETRRLSGLLPYQLRRAQEASFNAFARRVGDSHIWPGWYTILVIINDNPDINQTALSIAIERDKSTLTTSLRELDKAGIIKRTPDPADGRSWLLRLTDTGKSHLKVLSDHARLHEKLVDEIVGTENKAALLEI